MSLRDQNPLIDHDLSQIISSYEMGMLNDSSEESVLASFRGDLEDAIEIPTSILGTANSLPSKEPTETATKSSVSLNPITSSASTISSRSALVTGNPTSGSESQTDNIFGFELPDPVEEEWKKKLLQTLNECVPCNMKIIAKFDTKLIDKKLLDTWKASVKGLKDISANFKKKIMNNGSVFADFCSLGKQLKFHCLPDLEKISWLLKFTLSQMVRKFSLDLNFFDKFVVSILTPVFNELMSLFTMIKNLAITPMKCVFDTLTAVTQLPEEFATNYGSMSNETLSRASRVLNAQRLRESQAAINRNQEMLLGGQNFQRFKSGLDKLSDEASLEKLKGYLGFGTRWVEEKVQWLGDLFEEITNRCFDKWNDKMSANSSKLDLIRLIKVVGAVIKAGKDGKLDCGTTSDPITEDDLRNISTNFNQNSPIQITVQEGQIVVTRNPSVDTVLQSQGDQPNTRLEQEIRASGNVPRIEAPPNVVLSKPIDSCLKKVTEEQASQVRMWIRQLEEEMAR